MSPPYSTKASSMLGSNMLLTAYRARHSTCRNLKVLVYGRVVCFLGASGWLGVTPVTLVMLVILPFVP
jgi:hypothetical protein